MRTDPLAITTLIVLAALAVYLVRLFAAAREPEASTSIAPAHEHDFQILDSFDHAPIGEYPRHTAFSVLACRCGATATFPSSNYQLTTPDFRDKLNAQLTERGLEPLQ